ncbi:Uncharacterized protein Rs2_28903 [Raphanus sativus]|nr:Uncharacterized protein Rs2_28902 [Raphanus sativus]KAJ4889155.1 Uncharacterized protein Rs2_28903 [Raphanus sativus]
MNQTSLRLELVPRDLDSPLTPADLPRGSTLSICRTRIRRRRRRSRREGTKPFPGLLKSELFGSDFVSSPMSPCTPNILRFKTMVSLVTPLLLSLLASKVTKLCDLGPNDSVCSLQWTREGSSLSVPDAIEFVPWFIIVARAISK